MSRSRENCRHGHNETLGGLANPCSPCLSDYYAEVSLGTPAQNFLMLLDTGSSNSWVMGSACGSSCEGRNQYNPSSSSTCTASSTAFKLADGTESVRGKLAADTVSLAGYEIHEQSFAIIDTLDESVVERPGELRLSRVSSHLAHASLLSFWHHGPLVWPQRQDWYAILGSVGTLRQACITSLHASAFAAKESPEAPERG